MSQSWNSNISLCIDVSALSCTVYLGIYLVWHLTTAIAFPLMLMACSNMRYFPLKVVYCINALTLVQFSMEALKRWKRKEKKRNDLC
jgi:hypothetical protein